MDPKTSAQDVHRCELCDENMVDMVCLVCPCKLCRACVGNHLSDDPSKHKLVKSEDRRTALILPICQVHLEKRCKNYCKECDKAVCPSCVSSDAHERHKFLDIVQIFNDKKEVIREDTQELEQEICPKYEESVKQMESAISKLDKDYKTLDEAIEKHRKEWHELIDMVANNLKNESEDMMKKQLNALNKQLQQVKDLHADVQNAIDSNKVLLNSSDVSKSLGYTERNKEWRYPPAKVEASVPRFLPQPINDDSILDMFGVLRGFSIDSGLVLPRLKVGTATKVMNTEPKIMSSVDTEIKHPESIAFLNEGKLWVAGNEGTLKLFRFDVPLNVSRLSMGVLGSSIIEKQVNVDKGPTDIAVAHNGDLIFGEKLENIVYVYKDARKDELINLGAWEMLSICTTSYGELLVAMTDKKRYKCRVVRFKSSEERQIIQYDHEGKNLYTPGMLRKYVKENWNDDICVADCNAGAVVVTDRAGQFKFRYTGNPSKKDAAFRPVGITTDSQSQILVSDSLAIHIIDRNGKFLRYLNVACSDPLRLATDDEDNLYVAETSGIVKKIQYMNKMDYHTKMSPSLFSSK